jgi:hypothetical protein
MKIVVHSIESCQDLRTSPRALETEEAATFWLVRVLSPLRMCSSELLDSGPYTADVGVGVAGGAGGVAVLTEDGDVVEDEVAGYSAGVAGEFSLDLVVRVGGVDEEELCGLDGLGDEGALLDENPVDSVLVRVQFEVVTVGEIDVVRDQCGWLGLDDGAGGVAAADAELGDMEQISADLAQKRNVQISLLRALLLAHI